MSGHDALLDYCMIAGYFITLGYYILLEYCMIVGYFITLGYYILLDYCMFCMLLDNVVINLAT